MGTEGRRAAIYARVSLDRDGQSASPERQADEARRLAAAKGWEVLEPPFVDRDLSAYKRGVRRPAYEELKAAVAAGRASAVVVYSTSRLSRSVRDFTDLLDFLQRHDCALASVSDPVDTSTASGRAMTTMASVFAELEAAVTQERVMSAHARAARSGQMHSGGSRAFGYDRDGTVNRAEAEVVRELADRALRGESWRGLATDLNERGVTTTMGNRWYSNTVSQMLRSPRLAGLRVHQVDGRRDVFPGTWEPILTEEQHGALSALRGTRERPARRGPDHLLSGLAVCGVCERPLKTMGLRLKDGRPFPRYQCVRQPGEDNCGGVAAAKGSLEAFVVGRVLDFLSSAELRPARASGRAGELMEAVEADKQALVELTQRRFVHRTLSDEEFEPARDALRQRVAAAEADLTVLRAQEEALAGALRPGERADLQAWWDGASHEERRSALRHALGRVVVDRARHRGGNRFQTDRVRLEFRLDLYYRAYERFAATATPEDWERSRQAYEATAEAARD